MESSLLLAGDTGIAHAAFADIPAIDGLRKVEGNALGFVPKAVYESLCLQAPADGRNRSRYQRLWKYLDNNDLTGFCYASFYSAEASIIQIVVRQDARRWHRAAALEASASQEAERRGCNAITARVAIDLESNLFWRGMGYTPIRQMVSTWLNQRESKSKRPLWLYRRQLAQDLFSVTSRGAEPPSP